MSDTITKEQSVQLARRVFGESAILPLQELHQLSQAAYKLGYEAALAQPANVDSVDTSAERVHETAKSVHITHWVERIHALSTDAEHYGAMQAEINELRIALEAQQIETQCECKNCMSARAIIAASEPAAVSGWMPIESAPNMSSETIQRIKEFLHQHKTSSLDGICPACDGEGEQGGQFSGGSWTCEACNGTGVAAPTGEPG